MTSDESQLFRVDASGHRTLLVTAPAGQAIEQVEASGRWVLTVTGLPQTDRIGNRASTAITVLDTQSGRSTVLVRSGVTTTTAQSLTQFRFDSLTVTHGSAYWITRSRSDSLIATAHRYVLATGATTDLGSFGGYRGPGQDIQQVRPYLLLRPTSLSLGVGTVATRTLVRFPPPKVPTAVSKYFRRDVASELFVTDGRAYAWQDGTQVSYWRPGLSQPLRFRLSRDIDVSSVAGPLLTVTLFQGESNRRGILDTRTGALLDFVDVNDDFRHAFVSLSLGQRIVLDSPYGHVTTLYRVVPSELPVLRC